MQNPLIQAEMKGPDDGNADDGVPEKNDESRDGGQKTPNGESDLSHDARLAHFIRMLSDDNEADRWKAAEMLGRLEDSRAVDELIGALWDDDARVRLKAAWALGRIGDARAHAPLQRLYRMENEDVRDVIKEALENIQRGLSRE
jgi:hypothetical protein